MHTATADAGLVDRAAYPDKNAVHLLASRCTPDDGQVPAGEYAFAVLTDDWASLLSTDSAAARRIYIDQAGRISSSSETHSGHASFCGDGTYFTTVPISPFDDAPAPDAPYRLVVASRAAVDACTAAGNATGFGCADVDAMAVTFRVDLLESSSPSPAASPSVSPAPTESGSPDASRSVDPSPSPSGSDAGPGGSPAATATPAASPSPTPPPATAAPPQTPRPNTGGGSSGGNPVGSPIRTPAPTPYVIPSGFLDCPGQIVTPTGCKPIDWEPSIAGQTPQPSWSWGAAPTGVPVFPGGNAPSATPGTGGGAATPSSSPGSSTLGPVQAGVDLGASASPSGALVPGSSFGASNGASNGASATAGGTAVAGGVAGITSGPSGVASPPAQPVPTASTTPSTRPALPMLLAVLMLALVGAAAAAIVGWARRGIGRRAGTEH